MMINTKILFLKNKKAEITFPLIHLIKIGLEVVVVLLLVYLALKLTGLLTGRQDYDSAINNIEELSKSITAVVEDGKKLSIQTTNYALPDNYILVGFSYEDKGIMRTSCTNENIIKSRPNSCQSKSCLCIYQNFGSVTDWSGKDFDDKGNALPVRCKQFDEKIVFLAPQDSNFRGDKSQWNPNHYATDYYYLVLYGICGGPWRTSWGIKQIYIEKYKENGNVFIFIGDLTKEEIIKRKNEIKNRILNAKSI